MTSVHSPVELGLVIRERRRQLGLDQRALAERVGVSRQWIVQVERGKPRAEIGLLLQTLRALGLSLQLAASERSARSVSDDLYMNPYPDLDINAIIERARESS